MSEVDSVFLSMVYDYVKRKVKEENEIDLIPPNFLIYRMETAENSSLLSRALKRAIKEKVFFDSYSYEKETLEKAYENLKKCGLLTPLALGLSDRFVERYALEGNKLKTVDLIGVLISSRMHARVLDVLKRRYGIDEEKVYSILEDGRSNEREITPTVNGQTDETANVHNEPLVVESTRVKTARKRR